MSAFKFKVGEPRKVTLGFDEPKTGSNSYGNWYMYGIKNGDLSSDEDCFFATHTLHTMIQTLGAKEGDEITIEKCIDGEMSFFKVNGLSVNDMNNAGSVEKVNEAKPKSFGEVSFELDLELSIRIEKLEERVEALEGKTKVAVYEEGKDGTKFDANDIPF